MVGIQAQAKVYDKKGNLMKSYQTNPFTGHMMLALNSGESYDVVIEAPGYMGYNASIDVPAHEKFTIHNNVYNDQLGLNKVYMDELREGNSIALNNIYFEYNKDVLKPESKNQLDLLVKAMNDYESMKIEVVGHTDAKGTDDYNKKLSKQRSKAVKNYLKEAGIKSGRVKTVGMGEAMPIASNETDAGRALNRRTEFRVLKLETPTISEDMQLSEAGITKTVKPEAFLPNPSRIEIGDVLPQKVHFLKGEASYITDYSKEKADEVVELMEDNETLKIKIVGHADNVADVGGANEKLSRARAETVKKYMIEEGIDASRLSISTDKNPHHNFRENKVGSVEGRRVEFEVEAL